MNSTKYFCTVGSVFKRLALNLTGPVKGNGGTGDEELSWATEVFGYW